MTMFEFEEPQYKEGDEGLLFSDEIMATSLPPEFKESTDMEGHYGTTNP